MKKLILIISLFLTTTCFSQEFKLTKNDYAIISAQLVAGFAMGWHEAMQAGHVGNADVSWKFKYRDWDGGDYREAFPGSKTIFVGFTDDYHKSNLITNTANLATLTIALSSKEKLAPWVVVKKVVLSFLANRLAFTVSYNGIFK